MMTAVQGGKSFSDAATVAGVTPKLSPLVTRNERNPDVPPELQRVMFGLKKGEATMVETPEGFVVGQFAGDRAAGCGSRQAGLRAGARRRSPSRISNDIATVFIEAVRLRANPQINQQGFDSIVQPQ